MMESKPDSWRRLTHPEKRLDEEWESNTSVPVQGYSESQFRIGKQAYDIAGNELSLSRNCPVFRKKVNMAKDNEYSYVRLSGQKEWVLRWQVTKLATGKQYVVAMKADGTWGCACPAWTMGAKVAPYGDKGVRPDCKHIKMIQGSESQSYINDRITAAWKLKGQIFGSPSSIASMAANGELEAADKPFFDPKKVKAAMRKAEDALDAESYRTYVTSPSNVVAVPKGRVQPAPVAYAACPDCGRRFVKEQLLTALAGGRCTNCAVAEMRRLNEMNALAEKVKAQQRVEQAELDSMIVQTKKRVVHIRKREEQ